MKDPVFVNKIVKQGNSLCVRIPLTVVKELSLHKGNDVSVQMHKVDYKKLQKEYEEEFVKTINKIPDFKKMGMIKKKLFSTITFELLKKSQDIDEKKEEKNRIKIITQYEKELGKEIISDYIKFSKIFNKHATIIEKDGSVIVKPKFR